MFGKRRRPRIHGCSLCVVLVVLCKWAPTQRGHPVDPCARLLGTYLTVSVPTHQQASVAAVACLLAAYCSPAATWRPCCVSPCSAKKSRSHGHTWIVTGGVAGIPRHIRRSGRRALNDALQFETDRWCLAVVGDGSHLNHADLAGDGGL